MFQSGGYNTGYVGKWHLGTRMTTKDGSLGPDSTDFTKPIQIVLRIMGSMNVFFLPGSLDMFPYAYARGKQWQGSVTAQKGWSANRVAGGGRLSGHQRLPLRDEAGQFTSSHAKREKPFFLFVALTGASHAFLSGTRVRKGRAEWGFTVILS